MRWTSHPVNVSMGKKSVLSILEGWKRSREWYRRGQKKYGSGNCQRTRFTARRCKKTSTQWCYSCSNPSTQSGRCRIGNYIRTNDLRATLVTPWFCEFQALFSRELYVKALNSSGKAKDNEVSHCQIKGNLNGEKGSAAFSGEVDIFSSDRKVKEMTCRGWNYEKELRETIYKREISRTGRKIFLN